MQQEQIRRALDAHWRASAAGDADAEHEIYALLTPEQRKEISDRHHDHEKGTRDHEGRPPA